MPLRERGGSDVSDAAQRPAPERRNAGAEFWKAAARGVLMLPKCEACARFFWHPRTHCPRCGSSQVGWAKSTGLGRIHTYTVVRQSGDPYFKTKLPYAVAMVELEDGVRLMSNIVDTPLEALAIDLAVEVLFERVDDTMAIPLFRARRAV